MKCFCLSSLLVCGGVAVSWGGRLENAPDQTALIGAGSIWQYRLGRGEASEGTRAWTGLEFNDSAWSRGRSGLSYGYGYYEEATVLPQGYGDYYSLYLRKRFEVIDVAQVRWLVLRLDYSDGFVAYLNGVEVARRQLPGDPGAFVPFNTAAAVRARGVPEEVDLTAFRSELRPGANVLAIQVHGTGLFDANLSVLPEVWANFTRGPFLQSTASTGTRIVWRTARPASGWVEYGLDPELGSVVESGGEEQEHVVLLQGLSPATRYYYRAGAEAGGERVVGDTYSFKTLAESGPVRFAVLGDSGLGGKPQFDVADVLRGTAPDVVLHTGDVVYPSFTLERADFRCLSVYREQMTGTPFYFAIGNHDQYSGEQAFYQTFYLPTNSFDGTEQYYSFDHGDAHFVALKVTTINVSGLKVGDAQYNWLAADLAASQKPWKFIYLHHVLKSSAYHGVDSHNADPKPDAQELSEVLQPLAAAHGVQVIFSGHDHAYERFAPEQGVHLIVTAGGGGSLYGMWRRHRASARFISIHHCVQAAVDGDELRLEAVDSRGEVIDRMTIRRAPEEAVPYQAGLGKPAIEPGSGTDSKGNWPGQTFDFAGESMAAVAGLQSNLGRLHVRNDSDYIYLGLEEVMLYPDQDICLFLGSGAMPQVMSLAGLGNGLLDEDTQGVNAIDFMENLAFDIAGAQIVCVLGDEFADGTFRQFTRPEGIPFGGQGVFRLDEAFSEVAGARVQQFDYSPQGTSAGGEQNANFIEVAVPLEALGFVNGNASGAGLFVSAVVGGPAVSVPEQSRFIDSGYHGESLRIEDGRALLKPRRVLLADTLDSDGDGATDRDEAIAGTDPLDPASRFRVSIDANFEGLRLRWTGRAGRAYQVKEGGSPHGPFTSIGDELLPAGENELMHQAILPAEARTRYFRVSVRQR